NNAAIQALEDRIASLEAEKAGLSPTKTDKSIAMISIDATIAKWKKRLADTPATIKTTTKAPNPQLSSFAGDIAKAEVELATKREAFKRAMANQSTTDIGMYGELERLEAALKQDVERHRQKVAMFTKTLEDLSLRAETNHDPVTILAPAFKPVQVAPRT